MRVSVRSSGFVCTLCRSKQSRTVGAQWRRYYSAKESPPKTITIEGRTYPLDSHMNTPPAILANIPRRLHLQKDHPLSITRQIIESRFPDHKRHNALFPVVSVHQNFDSLGFAPDHPGRAPSDTYYINKDTVLRTHTSAHEADTFRANESAGYLISADVYRRDAVDRSHYPVFHQMEGAQTWDRRNFSPYVSLADAIWADVEALPKHDIDVEDPNPTIHPERNPLQRAHHSPEEVEAIAAHLKRSLELVVVEIFTHAQRAAAGTDETASREPLRVRWVEAFFPFTSPSWELEVFWQGDWLEVLGCGVTKQDILIDAGVPERVGWAFGLGLERIAMLLFDIPDIRLFWSKDARFLSQFKEPDGKGEESGMMWDVKRFQSFSKYPAAPRDVAFWLPSTTSPAGGQLPATSGVPRQFHENDVMEVVREVAGSAVEDVRLVDEFVHPKTGRKSLCYRVNYRSLERTFTAEEVNALHEKLRKRLTEDLGVELR
ncbi:phenylalanyl-tRNA synthetase [Patellaria atrata CBS 101060]|uniref:Phenylalanine--tRNA ligase, mitochondrial n=1 Tax=Patellaria atrata CBS 101060 TaxID=1346257 RepID=A0A9P4SBA6_9PEZI|nr:phenylalanyl-tRNA synthetase [Patellaria atrata CBS 101060]